MIIIKLDKVMADKKISNKELADIIGITPANLSNIKRGSITSIRFSTLNKLCKELNCQPRDLLEYEYDFE